jgi:hypothetical protein
MKDMIAVYINAKGVHGIHVPSEKEDDAEQVAARYSFLKTIGDALRHFDKELRIISKE